MTKLRVHIEILVGVDQHFFDLRRETLKHPRHHGFAAQFAQALVDAAHAPALAAGKYHARDASYHFLNRCLPVNSR